jgi:hypothetical protein
MLAIRTQPLGFSTARHFTPAKSLHIFSIACNVCSTFLTPTEHGPNHDTTHPFTRLIFGCISITSGAYAPRIIPRDSFTTVVVDIGGRLDQGCAENVYG